MHRDQHALREPRVRRPRACPVCSPWCVAIVRVCSRVPQALSWGLICGFESFIPYFYFVFFLAMIVHRAHRDQQRCAAKYGQDWVKYTQRVPYIFLPGIY